MNNSNVIDDYNIDMLIHAIKEEGIDCRLIPPNDSPYIPDVEVVKTICRRLLCVNIRSLILTGSPGAGKTSLVNYLACFFRDSSFQELNKLKILSVDVSSLLAGSEYRGSFEKKVIHMLDLCEHYNNIIIFFDEAHCLSKTNFKDGIGILDILKPRIIASNIRLILATTNEEVEFLSYDLPFMRRVHEISLPPLSYQQKYLACSHHIKYLLSKHNVEITPHEVENELELKKRLDSGKEIHEIIDEVDFYLTGKVIDEN